MQGNFTVPKHVSDFFASVEKLIPGHILGMIISSKPDNDRVTVVSCKETSYARWRKHTVIFCSWNNQIVFVQRYIFIYSSCVLVSGYARLSK